MQRLTDRWTEIKVTPAARNDLTPSFKHRRYGLENQSNHFKGKVVQYLYVKFYFSQELPKSPLFFKPMELLFYFNPSLNYSLRI